MYESFKQDFVLFPIPTFTCIYAWGGPKALHESLRVCFPFGVEVKGKTCFHMTHDRWVIV